MVVLKPRGLVWFLRQCQRLVAAGMQVRHPPGRFCSFFSRTGFACLLIAGCSGDQYEVLQGQTMGTYFVIKHPATSVCQVPQQTFQDALEEVNNAMSTYIALSEISKFNASAETRAIPISKQFHEVLSAAEAVYQHSGGAFDVTVGPLVNLWGFGPNPGSQRELQIDGLNDSEHHRGGGVSLPPAVTGSAPDPIAQREAAARVGMHLLEVGTGTVRKLRPDIEMDVSALAKGYAVDQLAEILDAAGCTNHMVDIGGEMRLAGVNEHGQPWRIGIEQPDASLLGVSQVVLALTDRAVATSGDYRNFRVVDGRRVDHVIDPRSGKPADNVVTAVTVIHKNAMLADAYATTLMVLDPEAGLALARKQNFAVHITFRSAPGTAAELPQAGVSAGTGQQTDGFEVRYNRQMQSYFLE